MRYKNYMKQTILLYLCFVFYSGYTQIDSIDFNKAINNMDSIQFSLWDVHNKEMSTLGETIQEYQKLLNQKTLSKSDEVLLIKSMRNAKSYDQLRALPYHYNLVFKVYKAGVVSMEARISTITGNIDIDTRFSRYRFKNNCSEQMNNVVIDLLKRYNFFEQIDAIDLEGLVPH